MKENEKYWVYILYIDSYIRMFKCEKVFDKIYIYTALKTQKFIHTIYIYIYNNYNNYKLFYFYYFKQKQIFEFISIIFF